jgi:hypothetical protein
MTTTTPPARQPAVRPQPSGAAGATGVGGTVVLVATRSLLWLGVQLLVAGLLVLGGTTAAGHPLNAAAAWWMVDGALIDLGTLGLIGWLLRRDGRSYRSLLGPPAAAWQVALGALGVLAATVPAMVLGAEVNKAFYGDATPPMLAVVDVPLLASAFSVVVVPLLAGLAEPVAYLGVVLPRLERRIGQPWVATTIVVAVWAVEHAWAAAPSAARGLDPAGGDRAGEVSGPGGALAGGVSNHVGPERPRSCSARLPCERICCARNCWRRSARRSRSTTVAVDT